MKDTNECPQPSPPTQGFTQQEATTALAGWDDARKGLPFTHANGPLWTEGWIAWHCMKAGPRSWRRH